MTVWQNRSWKPAIRRWTTESRKKVLGVTVYISPNPGKAMAYGISQRAAQILLTHGARVLMQTDL